MAVKSKGDNLAAIVSKMERVEFVFAQKPILSAVEVRRKLGQTKEADQKFQYFMQLYAELKTYNNDYISTLSSQYAEKTKANVRFDAFTQKFTGMQNRGQ